MITQAPPVATASLAERDDANHRLAFLLERQRIQREHEEAQREALQGADDGAPMGGWDNLPPINWLPVLAFLLVFGCASAGIGAAYNRATEPCACLVQHPDGRLEKIKPPPVRR